MRSIFRVGGYRRLHDAIDHAIKLAQDFTVCEAQDTIASRNQIGRSFSIVNDSRIGTVLVAVQLNNQFCIVAAEVGDVFVKRDLATEVKAAALEVAQA